jgi:hypothetical protein
MFGELRGFLVLSHVVLEILREKHLNRSRDRDILNRGLSGPETRDSFDGNGVLPIISSGWSGFDSRAISFQSLSPESTMVKFLAFG